MQPAERHEQTGADFRTAAFFLGSWLPVKGECSVHRMSAATFVGGAFLFALLALPARAQQSTSVTVGPSLVDTIAAQLVELELQRVSNVRASVAFTDDMNARVAALRQRLRVLGIDGSAERIATDRVLRALDAREARLADNLSRARFVYTDQYPPVRQLMDEIQVIARRRNAIRSAGL
jgi:hypothetical protein